MIANPRYGSLGLLAMPFFLCFEFFGPVVEALGPAAAIASFLLGRLSTDFMIAFLAVSLLLGTFLSIAAIALEEFSFRRHMHGRDAGRLLTYAILENFGYHQLVAIWRAVALIDLGRHKKVWGAQQRRGIGKQHHTGEHNAGTPPVPAPTPTTLHNHDRSPNRPQCSPEQP